MAWIPMEEGPMWVVFGTAFRLLIMGFQDYIFAQLMGGLVGAALIYANYFHAIDIFEGGRGIRTLKTASLFSTYAVSDFDPYRVIG